MYNEQILNPAYTGIWNRIGVTALVRKQFSGVKNAPLTECISMYSPLGKHAAGIGLDIINDKFGSEHRFSVLGNYAYEIKLTHQIKLRMGVKFGFVNYKNPLSEYELYPDGVFDKAFQDDIKLKYLPSLGLGLYVYREDFYVGFSMPKIIKNDLKENVYEYTVNAGTHVFYLNGGCIIPLELLNYIVFKPTLLIRIDKGTPLEVETSANFLFHKKLWLGMTYRTNKVVSLTGNYKIGKKCRLGFAVDLTHGKLFPYQHGSFEFSFGVDMDYFRRTYLPQRYF